MKRLGLAASLLLLALATGCATLSQSTSNVGDVSVEQKKRHEDAVRVFDEKRNFAQLQAALSRWQSGDIKGCREVLDNLLARVPKNEDGRLMLADLLLFEQQPEAAAEQLKSVLADDPACARAQHTMGLVMESTGQTEEALAYYQRAAELEPKNELFAMSCQTAQDAARAQAQGDAPAAETAQAADGGSDLHGVTTNAQALQWLDKGSAALADGDANGARAAFLQAAAIEPGRFQIPLQASILSLRCEHPEIAIDLLAPATQRFAGNAALYRVLGTAHYRLGDYRSAQQALQQAVSLDNSDALAYFLMGCTLKKLGQTEAADRRFEQARNLDPKFAVTR